MLSIGTGIQKPAPADEPARETPAAAAPESVSKAATKPAGDAPENVNALPVDLAEHCRFKAAGFDKATLYPWPAVPRGPQTFAHVPLEISGAIFLWGEQNTKHGMKFPEKVTGIPVGRKFETLYACHGGFFEGKAGTPMYEIHFQYDDGTSAADTILCGDDARDWFVGNPNEPLGPSGKRSTLAWKGEGKYENRPQLIRFCLSAIANPHPDKVVKAIDLVSAKSETAACILAITVGEAGLMKKAEEKPASDEKGALEE
jgi:hypothetical protein